MNSASNVKPIPNPAFREKLLDMYLEFSSSAGLSDWLKNIQQDPAGTREEKVARVRQSTKYLSMHVNEFPKQTLYYLQDFAEVLPDFCSRLGLEETGTKDILKRRIYREVGYQEAWLPRHPKGVEISMSIVLPFVQWYPILKNRDYEKDYYKDFFDEMAEVFGEENVHEQVVVAHGQPLKIDFHIGHPTNGGVGVEFKMPLNNSDVQKALGQVEMYQRRYGAEMIVVLIPDLIDRKLALPFIEDLNRKGIVTVEKTKVG